MWGNKRTGEKPRTLVSLLLFPHNNKWKTSFPKLRVSKLFKDICVYCYAFANCHTCLANRAIGRGDDGSNDNEGNDNIGNKQSVNATNADNDEEGTADSSLSADLNTPEALWRKNDKERELMLFEAAEFLRRSRVDRGTRGDKIVVVVDSSKRKVNKSQTVRETPVDMMQWGVDMQMLCIERQRHKRRRR